MNSPAGRPALFLDRDGTLTREQDWVTKPSELVLLPGAAAALVRSRRAGLFVVLVTNQSAIARGLLSETGLEKIHRHLEHELANAGARIDAFYHCPHHPTEGQGVWRRACECRKPRPGMLLTAAGEHALDLSRSWIVGDAERDLCAGRACGVRGILVATGKGRAEAQRMRTAGSLIEPFVPDLAAAVDWILSQRDQGR